MKKFVLLYAVWFVCCSMIYLSQEQMQTIGQRIWQNECNGSIEGLVCWNKGEEFPSVGIGHFVWYPQGAAKQFEETFPELLLFFEKKGVKLPAWLAANRSPPFKSREEFLAQSQFAKVNELRQLLSCTVALQAEFIALRFQKELERLLKVLPSEQRATVHWQVERLSGSESGLFALVDYINFKGIGISSKERYREQGWGLCQVLLKMRGTAAGRAAIEEFVQCAKEVLRQRVALSPPERGEARWLAGWENRLDGYLCGF
jgi:hypothetical protein